jgi:hypothetical protein
MRTCVTCGREFKPSSRHRKCSRCRDRERRPPCPGCGRPMSRDSTTCMKCRPPQPSGAASPNWKGGRIRHERGYVYVKAPGHPRARTNSGLVFEHILVMEKMLGRHLLPGENVHHRNGVPSDNRPDNLELWVRPQPSGCRVEDAVAWAREILARYENGPPPSGGGPA